jgi:hypothetical protein
VRAENSSGPVTCGSLAERRSWLERSPELRDQPESSCCWGLRAPPHEPPAGGFAIGSFRSIRGFSGPLVRRGSSELRAKRAHRDGSDQVAGNACSACLDEFSAPTGQNPGRVFGTHTLSIFKRTSASTRWSRRATMPIRSPTRRGQQRRRRRRAEVAQEGAIAARSADAARLSSPAQRPSWSIPVSVGAWNSAAEESAQRSARTPRCCRRMFRA